MLVEQTDSQSPRICTNLSDERLQWLRCYHGVADTGSVHCVEQGGGVADGAADAQVDTQVALVAEWPEGDPALRWHQADQTAAQRSNSYRASPVAGLGGR